MHLIRLTGIYASVAPGNWISWNGSYAVHWIAPDVLSSCVRRRHGHEWNFPPLANFILASLRNSTTGGLNFSVLDNSIETFSNKSKSYPAWWIPYRRYTKNSCSETRTLSNKQWSLFQTFIKFSKMRRKNYFFSRSHIIIQTLHLLNNKQFIWSWLLIRSNFYTKF